VRTHQDVPYNDHCDHPWVSSDTQPAHIFM